MLCFISHLLCFIFTSDRIAVLIGQVSAKSIFYSYR